MDAGAADTVAAIIEAIETEAESFDPHGLWYLDEEAFREILGRAVDHLVSHGPGDWFLPANEVITAAGRQFPALLVPHLERLWDVPAMPDSKHGERLDEQVLALHEAWRLAPLDERARLLDVLESGRSHHMWRDWFALLETRDPDTVEAAIRIAVDRWGWAARDAELFLMQVGFTVEDGRPRPLVPTVGYAVGISDRSTNLVNHEGPAMAQVLTGGDALSRCGSCHQALHRLVHLDPMPADLGVASRSALELATCFSCLGETWPMLWFEHDEAGTPHPLERLGDPYQPTWPRIALVERTVDLRPLPERWRATAWGEPEPYRLGGDPAWVQEAEFPACPRCTRKTTFLLQLDEMPADLGWYPWGSGGLGYVNWCDECAISVTHSQWS